MQTEILRYEVIELFSRGAGVRDTAGGVGFRLAQRRLALPVCQLRDILEELVLKEVLEVRRSAAGHPHDVFFLKRLLEQSLGVRITGRGVDADE